MTDLVSLWARKLTAVLVVFLCLGTGQLAADSAGLELTALDEYVRAPDPNYSYRVVNTVNGEGYTTFIVHMISQQWLTEAEVNLPIW